MPATEHAAPIRCRDLLNSLHAAPQAAMLQQSPEKRLNFGALDASPGAVCNPTSQLSWQSW